MARFSVKISNPYKETYKGILSSYDWIVDSLIEIGVKKETIKCSFTFKIGKIRCTVDSIDEFKEHAYGSAEYEFISGSVNVSDYNDSQFNSIQIILFTDKITISTCDKVLLTKIDDTLSKNIESNKSNDKVINQYNINGNNIAFANDNSTATVVSESPKSNVNNSKNQNGIKKGSKLKNFLSGILNNIVSNIIWYVLGLLVTGSVLAVLISNLFK